VRRTILANGHRFDSDLVCRAVGCSRSWGEQQVSPTRCGGELAIPYPRPAKRQIRDPFSILCHEHGVYQDEIQTTSGYGAHAVSLVMGGEAGGMVESTARELLRAEGVESGEDAVQLPSASIPD
jgi:hypothetical protein